MPPTRAAKGKSQVKTAANPSTSRDLVPVGPRETVFAKHHGKRNEDGQRPSTIRALVLRNGKHGARGTGEIVLLSKMSGREKLDLLAENLMERSKRAVATPFRLEKCLKIAQSQFMANLDDAEDLQDADAFYEKIKAEVNARKSPQPSGKTVDPFTNPTYVAGIVGSKIHNTYMFASAWRLIAETLENLESEGLEDSTIRVQLQKDACMRGKYLALYDVVNTLAGAYQARLAQLAATNPHYAQYFKTFTHPDTDEQQVGFEFSALKLLHKSFLDSVVIELCLPNPTYPRHILYLLLQEAIEESPRDSKRFHQLLWDAVGDLSDTVQLLELLESVILSPEGDKWRQEPQENPEHYERWLDAQWLSAKACETTANFKDVIHPLEKAKTPNVVKNMWKFVNLNYKQATGLPVDELWRLHDLHQRLPQWHAYHVKQTEDELNYDSDGSTSRMPQKKGNNKLLVITNGEAGNHSDDSMPSLQTVSDSSDAESEFEDGSGYDDDEDDSGDDYDTDDEDQMRDMYREAMAAAAEADLFGNGSDPSEFDTMAEDRKDNPFIKLLGALRGRIFSSNPTVKTPGAQARQPAGPRPVTSSSTTHSTAVPQSRKATVEEVEDEADIATAAAKKKKKKKKPKKKKNPAVTSQTDLPQRDSASQSPQISSSPSPAGAIPDESQPAAPAAPKKKKKTSPAVKAANKIALAASSTTALAFGSTVSLPLIPEQTAQSARSYIQSEGLTSAVKQKVKTRHSPSSLDAIPEKKKSIFARFKRDKSDEGNEEDEKDKQGFFRHLSKKTAKYMSQIIGGIDIKKGGIAPLKWENFLKVMREMGFQYDPSTAGSSVRFDPPSSRDPPITFHKPHPDTTLYPNHLRDFGRRLKKNYGWNEEDFYRSVNAAA